MLKYNKMIENKKIEKQVLNIHNKLLKIYRDNLERKKNFLINNTAKIKNKRKENGELKNENECRRLLFSNKIVIKINKNKYEFI